MHQLMLFSAGIFFITGIFAGIVDAIAGGGGLISVPVMLMMGVPPVATLGTNRMQSMIGEITASIHFYRSNHLNIKRLLPGIICAGIGGLLGSISLAALHETILNKIIPFLLLAILVYIIFPSRLNRQSCHARMSELRFFILFGLIIGFYNGFFGPGTGSFWLIALMFFIGLNFKHAITHAKPMNIMGNLGSLVYLISIGKVVYWIVLFMSIGQIVGARFGAYIVIHKSEKIIKPLFILLVLIMTISLFIKNYT